MAITRISTVLRTAMADTVTIEVDGGPSAGVIELRTGAQPATPETADSGTLLGTMTFSDPAFPAASAGVATASAITDDSSADATGVAGHFRVKDSTLAVPVVLQGDVTATAGGGTMEIDDVNIVIGGTIAVTSFTVTVPAS